MGARLEGVYESAAAAERAYRNLDAPDRFVLHIQRKTGHAFGEPARQAAIEWFVRWLKPQDVRTAASPSSRSRDPA